MLYNIYTAALVERLRKEIGADSIESDRIQEEDGDDG